MLDVAAPLPSTRPKMPVWTGSPSGVELETAIAFERMRPLDPWEGPPEIDPGARVEIMTAEGGIRPWQFADGAAWHEAIAYRTVEGELLQCFVCEEFTMSPDDMEELGCCKDCWLMGERG